MVCNHHPSDNQIHDLIDFNSSDDIIFEKKLKIGEKNEQVTDDIEKCN